MNLDQDKIYILDCSLRDGSYANNFQFTAKQTKDIVLGLESCGVELLEIGHGLGLRASEKGYGVAAETDEGYMRAASNVLSKAHWGMFCIPGVAELKDLEMAADYGMGFVRIGTNIDDYRKSIPFVELAKKLGMYVCSNFMKSYASPPKDLVKSAQAACECGSDLIYLVDSAGGMLPNEVETYLSELNSSLPGIATGFHGHNNLGLAVANSLVAIDNGVTVVDSTLQGFGRSSGNTPTGQIVSCLIRKGVHLGIDPIRVMDVGEQYIRHQISEKGLCSVDVISGMSQFHSSYFKIIDEKSKKYRVDPRRLIIAVAERDKVNAPPEMVDKLARSLVDKYIIDS